MKTNNVAKMSALFLGLSLAACVAPTEPLGTAVSASTDTPAATVPSPTVGIDPVVTAQFLGGGGNWQGTGRVVFRYTAIERNNEIYICGAFTGQGSSRIRSLSREVMRQASVTSNGETIMRNLRFFREASSAKFSSALVGVETICNSTGLAAGTVPLEGIRVKTRDGRYRVER